MNLSANAEAEQVKWALEHVSDSSEKWVIPIESVPFTIGRDEVCDLTLGPKWVSRHHAQIRSSGGMFWICDLGSTNGTCVNYKLINKSELLKPDDIISFGKHHFCFKKVDSIRQSSPDSTIQIDLTEELTNLVSLEPKLRKILREQNVTPYFQPVLRFSDMHVIGYKILGRIFEDDLPLNTGTLFEVAASLGCASKLSVLCREKGVDLGRRLPGSPVLFVNTAPSELERLDVLMESLRRIRKAAISNPIILEISEKAMPHTDEMKQFRSRLADLNVALAFDDFEVSQTRLVELQKTSPDFLKFDMSLIRDIHLAPKRLHQMLLTFVKAARDLGIGTVAEGIECLDESKTCRQLGFECVQGYLYGRPSPITEFESPER
jgi:EAL domain-containing protein (putative c-di-GMP-specific phosphodiesterase class I)